MPACSVCDLISRSAASAKAVCCTVGNAAIRLGFDDHSGNTLAVLIWNDDQFAEQIAGDCNGVFAKVKFVPQVHIQILSKDQNNHRRRRCVRLMENLIKSKRFSI